MSTVAYSAVITRDDDDTGAAVASLALREIRSAASCRGDGTPSGHLRPTRRRHLLQAKQHCRDEKHYAEHLDKHWT